MVRVENFLRNLLEPCRNFRKRLVAGISIPFRPQTVDRLSQEQNCDDVQSQFEEERLQITRSVKDIQTIKEVADFFAEHVHNLLLHSYELFAKEVPGKLPKPAPLG